MSRRETEDAFQASYGLAKAVGDDLLENGLIYPPLAAIRDVSSRMATVFAQIAYDQSLGTEPRPGDVLAEVKTYMHEPDYPRYA